MYLIQTRRVENDYGRQTAEDQWRKNVYLRFNGDGNLAGNSDINLQRDNLERVIIFRYLSATLAENGGMAVERTHVIQSGWRYWVQGIGDYVRPKNKFES